MFCGQRGSPGLGLQNITFNKSLLVIRVCFQKKGGLAGGPNGRDMGESSDGERVISIGSVGEVSCATDGGVVVCAGN